MSTTLTMFSDAQTVHAIIEPPHEFVEVHHRDDAGRHFCPTGFAMCTGRHDSVQTDCTEVRNFDGDCRLWGARE